VPDFTREQLAAIERREGDLLLDAGAGSGKTSVLCERFVRAVLEDGVDVSAILAITFTDKAAAELGERIRARLEELGAREQARATEGAFISTIHGFCARLLRAHALAAGLDPRFIVLDELEAARLADLAFDDALSELDDVELIASYGAGALRGAILGAHGELRSRGERSPRLPTPGAAPDPAEARARLQSAAAAAATELGTTPDPTAKVRDALERLELAATVEGEPWPGELEALKLPNGNGAALQTPVCTAYSDALEQLRTASEQRLTERAHASLDRLLSIFGTRYAERKRRASGLDFDDLELIARDLLQADGALRERYGSRFEHIMVDELQDTNGVQLELIESLARDNLFAVGDAQQSIYAFRHADVTLFESLAERLGAAGRRLTLDTNFRSRREILAVVNAVFGGRELVAGREDAEAGEARVELLVVSKEDCDWRAAEAQALAARVRELIDGGVGARDIVVLTRAATDLRLYERALEGQGIPTYVIGGRGYWSHPQVMDLVAYLRALANPKDQEALYQLLASPMVGLSFDGLVLFRGAREELAPDDTARLGAFEQWFAQERLLAARLGIEELIERALERTGYDLAMLALPGGQRRLANVRKLMRLGREHHQRSGGDLRGFLRLTQALASGRARDPREGEAPVEGDALDAVRLMTIHRAKGLEFEIVCVADLGREPRRSGGLLRVARDGTVGLRLARAGTGRPLPTAAYLALGEQQLAAETAEERRIFYVAMTRARERLILSGPTPSEGPIEWLSEALSAAGVTAMAVQPQAEATRPGLGVDARPVDALAEPAPALQPRPRVTALSYSSLSEYARCGYRFYLERVLGLPSLEVRTGGEGTGLSATERGVLVHELL
jgi:ATP-dependent exoDNAse (exonuclease V) beta subunit